MVNYIEMVFRGIDPTEEFQKQIEASPFLAAGERALARRKEELSYAQVAE